MTKDNYEVMVLKFEFWLSVILFVGGGALMWNDHSLVTPIFTIWGVLLTFWFSRRAAETNSSNLMNAMQVQPPAQIPQIPQIPQEPQTPITEQPAQPRAPSFKQPTEEVKANV